MAKTVKRAVTQEDLDKNPELVEQGVEIGTIMKLPPLESADEETDSDEDEEDTSAKVSFHIRNSNTHSGQSVRSFTEKEHGKDFKKIATEFEESNKGIILKKVSE